MSESDLLKCQNDYLKASYLQASLQKKITIYCKKSQNLFRSYWALPWYTRHFCPLIINYMKTSWVKMSMYCSHKSIWPCFDVTCTVSTGSSNTGWTRNVNQTERMKLVMKNPPHTAHISHSRLKEWSDVLSGTRALHLWTWRVVEGKYSLQGPSKC